MNIQHCSSIDAKIERRNTAVCIRIVYACQFSAPVIKVAMFGQISTVLRPKLQFDEAVGNSQKSTSVI
jgi:hypothetical protein